MFVNSLYKLFDEVSLFPVKENDPLSISRRWRRRHKSFVVFFRGRFFFCRHHFAQFDHFDDISSWKECCPVLLLFLFLLYCHDSESVLFQTNALSHGGSGFVSRPTPKSSPAKMSKRKKKTIILIFKKVKRVKQDLNQTFNNSSAAFFMQCV